MRALYYVLCAIFAVSSICLPAPAQADDLEKACHEMYGRLQTIKGATLARRDGDFTEMRHGFVAYRIGGGINYHGCILTLTGNQKVVTGDWYIPTLFNARPPKGNLYKEGWRVDPIDTVNKPSNLQFKIFKGYIDCLIDSQWDANIVNNRGNMQSLTFRIDVYCGKVVT
jgi:hypothetical protein